MTSNSASDVGGKIDHVTMSCADCGCVVARGRVVQQCDATDCCCKDLPHQTMETLVVEIRQAMETADLEVMGELLAPDARWGAPEQDVPTCRNAKQILAWYEIARDNGLRAEVMDTVIIAHNIVVGFKVLATRDGTSPSGDALRWQVLSVTDGQVAEIRGYETRRDATEFATTGVSHWRSS